MKTLKKLDIVIIVLLLCISFTPHFIFAKVGSKDYASTYAEIKISGKVYKNIPLSESNKKYEQKLVIDTDHGSNTILIEGNTVRILEADCHDDLCIRQGTISRVGQTLVCLPHELIIEIKGEESSDSDMILSH